MRTRKATRVGRAATPKIQAPHDPARSLVEAFLTNERINQVLLDLLEPRIWRLVTARGPRRRSSEVRASRSPTR
ncbi:MAG TPA: hypothetical protein VF530_08930 [Planctomycetota bacterium]